MPELPEVETTRRGIAPFLENKKILGVDVYNSQLRWPVSEQINHTLPGLQVRTVRRRAKYLIVETAAGYMLMHLGMSGSLRITANSESRLKHDHVVFQLSGKRQLRYNDPRRFGCLLWTDQSPDIHPLIARLGVEPLSDEACATCFFQQSRKRKTPVKNFIMDNHVIVGVGNIYANEALFRSGIRPGRAANRVTKQEYVALLENIQIILRQAIEKGGSTLRDFVGGDGKPGYFQQTLAVYGRAGQACSVCNSEIQSKVIGQRNSFYCRRCQQ